MNAQERQKAFVDIRILELKCNFYEAAKLAHECASKCWKLCDNFNYERFAKVAKRMIERDKQQAQE